MGRRPKQAFHQRRHIDGQEAHEKMFNIANYQRNANQYYSGTPPHTHQNGYYQKNPKETENNKGWSGYGEIGLLVHCWWECKMAEPLWKIVQ